MPGHGAQDLFPLTYIVRHGQTDWNVEGRLQGQADTDINTLGRQQADRNGAKLRELIQRPDEFDFVASPLRRTCETMERIRSGMGLPARGYRTDPLLKEVHFGDWQGFTHAELEAANPGCTEGRSSNKWRFMPPGRDAESYEKMSLRMKTFLDKLDGPTVCVTHGGIIRAVFHLIGGLDGDEAAAMDVPQDRILRLSNGKLEWL